MFESEQMFWRLEYFGPSQIWHCLSQIFINRTDFTAVSECMDLLFHRSVKLNSANLISRIIKEVKQIIYEERTTFLNQCFWRKEHVEYQNLRTLNNPFLVARVLHKIPHHWFIGTRKIATGLYYQPCTSVAAIVTNRSKGKVLIISKSWRRAHYWKGSMAARMFLMKGLKMRVRRLETIWFYKIKQLVGENITTSIP